VGNGGCMEDQAARPRGSPAGRPLVPLGAPSVSEPTLSSYKYLLPLTYRTHTTFESFHLLGVRVESNIAQTPEVVLEIGELVYIFHSFV
jgi:hypothetical protein